MKFIDKDLYQIENKPYYIYIHTCPNYETYVGMSKNPHQRWNNGEGYKSNIRFYDKIKKYGWANIKHDIVAETGAKWIAESIERTLITHFMKKDKNKCLNENNIEYKLLEKESVRIIPIKRVGKYDKNTKELIEEYNSIKDASYYNNIPEQGIRSTCIGKIKSSGGYYWKYL